MNPLHLGNSTPANRHLNIVRLVQSRGRIVYSRTTVGEDATSERASGSESGSTFWPPRGGLNEVTVTHFLPEPPS